VPLLHAWSMKKNPIIVMVRLRLKSREVAQQIKRVGDKVIRVG